MDSDLSVAGGATFGREVYFRDDVYFLDFAYFDSDVVVRGNLTVNGTQTSINNENLAVKDNLIVLNSGATTPFNDIGFIYTRYDSDTVSATNFNAAMLWDETQGQFIFGQTSSSGILPNPVITQKYLEAGQTVEFFDSENATRMVWNKSHARLSILNKDGSEAFAVDADTGNVEGNGTIDAGFY